MSDITTEEWKQFVEDLTKLKMEACDVFIKTVGDADCPANLKFWDFTIGFKNKIIAEIPPDKNPKEYVAFHILIGSTPNREYSPLKDLDGTLSIEKFFKDIKEQKLEFPRGKPKFLKFTDLPPDETQRGITIVPGNAPISIRPNKTKKSFLSNMLSLHRK